VRIEWSRIGSYTGKSDAAIYMTTKNKPWNYYLLEVLDTNVTGYGRGILFNYELLNRFNVTAYRYFYNEPSGTGLYISTPAFKSGYLRMNYSLLYRIYIATERDYPAYLHETVYDEANSVLKGPITTGSTDPTGRYTHQFIYRVGRSENFNPGYPFVNTVRVYADYFGVSGQTTHLSYFGDTLTSPSWYRWIEFLLPALAMKVLGFSHDMGTTYLVIRGLTGAFIGFYSYTPDEIVNPPSLQRPGGGFKQYPLRISQVSPMGIYIRIDAEILYEGHWQPTTIYINRISGIVWSPGPVDFRGWAG